MKTKKPSWKSLDRSKPPINELVELCVKVPTRGAPESTLEGWKTVGRMRESGVFSINQNKIKKVDRRNPTHWRELNPNP